MLLFPYSLVLSDLDAAEMQTCLPPSQKKPQVHTETFIPEDILYPGAQY